MAAPLDGREAAPLPGDVDPELELETLELELLLEAVAKHYGYDFREYTAAPLRRRIHRVMDAERVATVSALQDRLLHDERAFRRFVTELSVHVTTMFRDPAFYRALREKVVPTLHTHPFVRIWHAGCSTGEELHSLAILLHEEDLLERCRIYATDLSDDLVARAQTGALSLRSMRENASNYMRAGGRVDLSSYYRVAGESAVFSDMLRRNVVFSRHNLAVDRSFNEFQLIVCRNVLIDFDEPLRARVHALLHESLGRFGILALGMRESLQNMPVEAYYEPVDSDVRLYRRVL